DTIVVTGGVWKDTVGVILSISHNRQSITMNVDLFGRETPVEISFVEVRKM
ncbi:MAG: transcription termination/antitermination protein NusG, partial [Lachnospiraceae bacterium]